MVLDAVWRSSRWRAFTLPLLSVNQQLKQYGSGEHNGKLFVYCAICAYDDTVLLLPSCRGLQNLLNVCETKRYGVKWDIKFNPSLKNQTIPPFGGINPSKDTIRLSDSLLQQMRKAKYIITFAIQLLCYFRYDIDSRYTGLVFPSQAIRVTETRVVIRRVVQQYVNYYSVSAT